MVRFRGHGFRRVHYFVKLNTLRSCGPPFYALVKVMERSSEDQVIIFHTAHLRDTWLP